MSRPHSKKQIKRERNVSRKKDALALAELVYDIYKEKKRRDNSIVTSAGSNSTKEVL